MPDVTLAKIDDIQGHVGGAFKLVRSTLGVTSFGMQILDLPPNSGDGYPNHDHAETGQEEVYLVLRGSADIVVDDETFALDPSVVMRVGAGAKRQIRSGADGARVLALGGVPGAAYEVNAGTELASL